MFQAVVVLENSSSIIVNNGNDLESSQLNQQTLNSGSTSSSSFSVSSASSLSPENILHGRLHLFRRFVSINFPTSSSSQSTSNFDLEHESPNIRSDREHEQHQTLGYTTAEQSINVQNAYKSLKLPNAIASNASASIVAENNSPGVSSSNDNLTSNSSSERNASLPSGNTTGNSTGPSVRLCILAVPASTTISSLLEKASLTLESLMVSFRIVNEERPLHPIITIFKSFGDAQQFYRTIHGSFLSSRSIETYSIVHCSEIYSFRLSSPISSLITIPTPNSPNSNPYCYPPISYFLFPPTSEYVELPSCPRCLSRLDTSVSDMLSSINTREGTSTLSNSRISYKNSCPVCETLSKASIQRAIHPHSATPITSHVSPSSTISTSSTTSVSSSSMSIQSKTLLGDTISPKHTFHQPTLTCQWCSVQFDTREALWLCLICGHLGCGRYKNGHAYQHWEESGHSYNVELMQHYVWDYKQDGFVHRIHGRQVDDTETSPTECYDSDDSCDHRREGEEIGSGERGEGETSTYEEETNENDEGMPHGFDSSDEEGFEEPETDVLSTKLASIGHYYNELVISQLEEQRKYFETLIANRLVAIESETNEKKEMQQELATQSIQLQNAIHEAEKSLRALNRSVKERETRNRNLSEEIELLREMNTSLLSSRKPTNFESTSSSSTPASELSSRCIRQLAEKDKRLSSIQKQIDELMMSLDRQSKK